MRRLGISLLIVVLLATVGFGWALDRLFFELQPDEADRLAPYRIMGQSLADAASEGVDLTELSKAWPVDSKVQLGTLTAGALALPTELREAYRNGETLALEAGDSVMLVLPVSGRDAALTLSLPSANSAGYAAVRFVLTIIFYAGIVLLILLWVYPLVRRLHGLSKVANAIGAGDLTARVPLVRFSLIQNIETEFNAMADRIARLVEDNRLLSSAVSHDLRTPIARLRFGLDALSEESDPDVQDRYMQRISADLAEMEHLVEVLLDYARLEKQQRELPLQPLALVPSVTDRINVLFNDVTHEIDLVAPDEEVYVLANERYFDLVLNNVLQNALRYGESRVRVSIDFVGSKEAGHKGAIRSPARNDRLAWLVVEDDGPGIPDDERERVLKPFERGRANTDGLGYRAAHIGLAWGSTGIIHQS